MIEEENKQVKMGGSWLPETCQARHKVDFFFNDFFISSPKK